MHFGARQVQRLGQRRQCGFRDEAQLLLQIMEDFKQRIGLVAIAQSHVPSGNRLARGEVDQGVFSGHAALWRKA